MGGCVASVMDRQNESALVPHPQFKARIAYGEINCRITEDKETETGIYRRTNITPEEHEYFFKEWVKEPNVLQILEKNCVERAGKNALAYRQIEKITTEKQIVKDDLGVEKEKTMEFVHLRDPTHITYAELWELLTSFSRGLVALDEQLAEKYGSEHTPITRVALYEETRWEWLVSMLGLWSQSKVGVTVYANLGVDALVYALEEAECGAIILNGKAVSRLVGLDKERSVKRSVFIYLDELPADVDCKGHTVVSWKEVLELGREKAKVYAALTEAAKTGKQTTDAVSRNEELAFLERYAVKVPTDNNTVVLIMYTSGTTGNPKGVIHTIGALTQGAKGLETMLTELIGGEADCETYVCFLPAAHIFEFVCEIIFLSRGILLCFGSPRTLTDVFARPCGDVTCYKPFFLIGVPRIFEAIKKTVESKLPPVGSVKRQIFDRAYQSRLKALKEGNDTPFWNEKVFKQTRQLLGGGSMRGICSGGAPLADATQEFINVVLGVPVAQGYGMTESVCNATIQRTGELDCVAGQMLRGVEAKLLDTENYKHTDKPNPRGELCLRGNTIFKGYFKQDALTKETMMADGWMRTGDVAEWDISRGNSLRIIGRVKALAKNALGEYIALENLEALYGTHPVVMPNGIVVLVDPHKSYITALLLTDQAKAMSFAKANNIPGEWPTILESDAFNSAVIRDMAAIAVRERRVKFEQLQRVRVLEDVWDPENGLCTASMKVKRSAIDEHYADTIKQLFAD